MIVNPWIFYAMHACESAIVIAMICGIVSGFVLAFAALIFYTGTFNDTINEKDCSILKQVIKTSKRIMIGSALACILIPREQTLLLMQAARLATTDNINAIFEEFKEAIDYTMTVLK